MFRNLALILYLLFTGLPAFGQGADQKWLIGCNDTKECQMQQFIKVGEVEVSRLLVYRVDGADVLEFLVPLGVNLQRAPVVQIDNNRAKPTQMLECVVDGCRGFLKMDGSLRKQMKRGLILKIFVGNFKTKEELAFNFTLLGFTDAYGKFDKGSK